MRRDLQRLLCIFPFEEEFFRTEGVNATYIGHPLAGLVRPALSRDEFFRKHRLAAGRPLVAVLPGSRRGEAARHLPALLDAVDRLYREQAVNVVLPASATTGAAFFQERIGGVADSGDRRRELGRHGARRSRAGRERNGDRGSGAAGDPDGDVLQGDARPVGWPGKFLVRVPFYSMVNLIAGRAVVPELMQGADDRRGDRARGRAAAAR